MRSNSRERALEVLGDYLFELETAAPKPSSPHGVKRSVPEREAEKNSYIPSAFDKNQEYLASCWEKQKLKIWRKNGRITADGTLRVSREPLAPYTLKDLIRIMPHLSVLDRLAALIELNGVVKGGFLSSKEHENIREVVEHIADERLAIRLQHLDTTMVLKDLIRAEVSAIFDEVLTKAKTPISTQQGHKSAGRQNKCSKCHMPGHRATTCGKKTEPLTPPVEAPLEPGEETATA